MFLMEIITEEKIGASFKDGLISEIVLLDTTTSTFHHLVNKTYLSQYVVGLDDSDLTDREKELLTLGSTQHERTIKVLETDYQELWRALPLEDMPDYIGDLLSTSSDPRLVTTYIADIGILFTNLDLKFSEEGLVVTNSISIKALSEAFDYYTLARAYKLDSSAIYETDSIQARLLAIATVMNTFKDIL